MRVKSVVSLFANLVRTGSINFACIHLTTRCNAKCIDRCDIWKQAPLDMKLQDAKYVLDVLANNGFSVAYFTGGETGLYPYLAQVLAYAKNKGFVTSLTTNGTIPESTLKAISKNLDVISVSVDHDDKQTWEATKHFPGIAKNAIKTIYNAKALGIEVYAITFLNPAWTPSDVERIIKYANEELGVSFTLSYPYVSSSSSTFIVGGKLRGQQEKPRTNMVNLVAKVLEMKRLGFKVSNASCYLKDVLRALNSNPVKYPCNAGQNVIAVDCNLNVFPCYRKKALFNLKDHPSLDLPKLDYDCDNCSCLINGFKEPSLLARKNIYLAVLEEIFSNPSFYANVLF